MALLHPTEEDDAFAAGHAAAGLELRVKWVKKLREALAPFAEERANEADVLRAKRVLETTKEWL